MSQPLHQLSSMPLHRRGVTYVLHPGDVACGACGDRLQTLLGSCVAVILTDPMRTIGVMCHIVHASRPPSSGGGSCAYAEIAWETMFRLLRDHGIKPDLCEAYVYGGGNMFPDFYREGSVGDANVNWVLEALGRHGIPVVRQCVGRSVYRRLSWTVGLGEPRIELAEV